MVRGGQRGPHNQQSGEKSEDSGVGGRLGHGKSVVLNRTPQGTAQKAEETPHYPDKGIPVVPGTQLGGLVPLGHDVWLAGRQRPLGTCVHVVQNKALKKEGATRARSPLRTV